MTWLREPEKEVKLEIPVHPARKMYRKSQNPDAPEEAFELPFEGKLCEENRWVILANLIPWAEFEEEYALEFF